MNKIHKTIWNAVRQCVAVVSELCSACGSGRNSGKRPRRAKPRLSNRRFVPSVLVAALAGFFVSVNAFCAVANFNQHNIKVDALTESGEWKILEMSFHNLVQRGDPFVNKIVLDALLTTGEKYFHTVYGAYLRSSLIGSQGVYNLYEADGNNFYVNASSEPEDLNFNAEEWSVDEMGFNGIAGNFTVEDGKTLVMFGEAPLNGSYLGEGKLGTVNNGTLVFGLPYTFSGFSNGLSSGKTGSLWLKDGANVVFQNGKFELSRSNVEPDAKVEIFAKNATLIFNEIEAFYGFARNEGGETTLEISDNSTLEICSKGNQHTIDTLAELYGYSSIQIKTGSHLKISAVGANYEAIRAAAGGGGHSSIFIDSNSTATFEGGDGFSGMGANVHSSDREIGYSQMGGETGLIHNEGTLKILGGSDGAGLRYNLFSDYPSLEGYPTARIENTGTMLISGGEITESSSGGYGMVANIQGGQGLAEIVNQGEGTLTIQGGICEGGTPGSTDTDAGAGMHANAMGGLYAAIVNEGSGTLSILGGTNTYGIYINAQGVGRGGQAHIINKSNGTLIIDGGKDGIGIGTFGTDVRGSARLSNLGSGTVYIRNNGIGTVSTNSFKDDAVVLSNEGDGDFIIQAGDKPAIGLMSRGFEPELEQRAQVKIVNSGSGRMTLIGGSLISFAVTTGSEVYGNAVIENSGTGDLSISNNGIQTFVTETGTGTIRNSGQGTLTIAGGEYGYGIETLASGSDATGEIVNSGSGTMNFNDGAVHTVAHHTAKGSVRNTGFGAMIFDASVSYIANAEGTGTISNEGDGKLFIQGKTNYQKYGIFRNAYDGGIGFISNTGTGTLWIRGGEGQQANGLLSNAADGGTGRISNTGSGSLIIQGGSGEDSYGIFEIAGTLGSGTLSNGEHGTLSILGNKESGTYGIAWLTSDDWGFARLENAGVMILNKNAIETFGAGDVLVTNASTGTVNAEAGAIFMKESDGTQTGSVGISVLQKNEADWTSGSATVEGFDVSENVQSWALKDDWRLHSKWEDGGSLVITDVMEGSIAAQQIEAAFRETFGTGTSLTFKGENDEASEGLAPKFTTDVANALIAQGYSQSIVTNFNLDATDASGNAQALIVGGTEAGAITDSIGFRQIQGASSVTVKGDKTLALIGNIEGQDLIEGGGAVTLDKGGLLLGADAGTEATTGNLTTVLMTNASRVTAENGWFRMEKLSGEGDVNVRGNGRMYATDMNVKGNVKNAGTLSAESLTVSGSLETSKTLKSSGTIAVDSGSKLVADGYVVADKLDVKGVMIRGGKANVFTGAAAMDLLREANAEAAAEVDRVEGKAGISTMSVLDRIVAESMKRPEVEETESDQGKGEESETGSDSGSTDKKDDSSSSTGSSSSDKTFTTHRRASPVHPMDAQAFAAFDAVNRIASDIESGTNPDGHGLWVKLQTNESEFGARSGTKFEIDSDGAVIGAQAQLNPSWKVGAALSYLNGEIDSGLTKNDWKSYGLHAYAQYKEGAFGIKGIAGWLRGTTEADEDYKADVWHAGVRSEYDLVKGKSMTLTPFMGARLMSGSFDGMASQTVVNVPLGLKLAGELSTAGWTVTPALEASYVRSMGDTEVEDIHFLPKNAVTGALSLKAERGAWTGELSFRGAVGSNDYEDRSFTAKLGYQF